MKRSQIAGALAAVLWTVFWITAVILWIAGDGGLMGTEMLRCAPPETTGLAAAEYPGVSGMTAGYLTGRTDEFQYTVTDSAGHEVPCFRDYEASHMADCRKLIFLDRTARKEMLNDLFCRCLVFIACHSQQMTLCFESL